MLFFHALEFSAFWVFVFISILIAIDLIGASYDRLEPTMIGFIGMLVALHVFGVWDIVSAVYHNWLWAIVIVLGWLIIGLVWMILKYKWFLRDGMRSISQENGEKDYLERRAEDLSYEHHLNELVTWWIFWLPSMISTFIFNLCSSLKFFVVEVCGQWLKGVWKREFDKFFKAATKQ